MLMVAIVVSKSNFLAKGREIGARRKERKRKRGEGRRKENKWTAGRHNSKTMLDTKRDEMTLSKPI